MMGLDWTFCDVSTDEDSDDSCSKVARLNSLFLREAQECNAGEQHCPNCPWTGETGDRIRAKDAFHTAVEWLGKMEDRGEFGQWAAYLLEEIESSLGVDALERIGDILQERFAWEGW